MLDMRKLDIVVTTVGACVPGTKTRFIDQLVSSLEATATKPYELHIIENMRPYKDAVNAGIGKTTGDVLLLNDDVILEDGWELIRNGVGDVRGFKLLYPGSSMIQHAGGVFTGRMVGTHIGQYAWDTGIFNEPYPCPYVTGAAMYIRRPVIDVLGGFRSFGEFFFEDADFCLRAWKEGFSVFYNPVVSYHYDGGSREESSTKKLFSESHACFESVWPLAKTMRMVKSRIAEVDKIGKESA